jgi:hypothetical protein
MMRMYFAQLLNSLSVRAGNFSGTLCTPEAGPCDVFARLEGFDVNGNPVADSGDFVVGDTQHGDITTLLAVNDPSGRIASATLFMGKGTAHSDYGNPVPAQIDHLIFTSTGIPTPNVNAPPSVTITAPTPMQSFSYPFQVTFSGNVSAPAGLRAFCTTINNTTQPPSNQCDQIGSLDLNGNFSFAIQPQDLAPGTNTLSAFVYDLANRSAVAAVTFSLQTPPPPSIVIFAPSQDYCLGGVVRSGVCWLNSGSNIQMTGSATLPGGLLAFCTGANEASPPSPSQCNQTGSLGYFPSTGMGSFTSVPVPNSMLVPGSNTLDAWVYDRFGQLGQAHVNVMLPADPRVIAMEVTQGIQTVSIPHNTPGTPVPYSGVRLFFGGKTVVRVFANTPAGTLPDVPAFLYVTQGTGSQTRYLGLVLPDNGPKTLTPAGPTVTQTQRATADSAYVFTLPFTFDLSGTCQPWESCISATNGPLTLYAVLYSSGDFPPASVCPGCTANSMMTLTNINFDLVSTVRVSPVSVTWTGSNGVPHVPNADPNAVFAKTGNIFPPYSANLAVAPYIGTIDISDLVTLAISRGLTNGWLESAVLARVSGFGDNNPIGQLVGVSDSTGSPSDVKGKTLVDLGLTSVYVYGIPPRAALNSIMNQNRPLTSVTHEFFHEFWYIHASSACGAPFPTLGWPPDHRGDIQGIGLDRSSESNGTYRIISPGSGLPGQNPEEFDFMSYCANANDSDAWISVINWNAWGSTYPNLIPPCVTEGCFTADQKVSSVGPNQQTLRVTASIDKTGRVTIQSVQPGGGKHVVTLSNSTDQTNYNLVVRDASGQVVSRTHITPIMSNGWGFLSAEVLSTAAARVEIENNGSVVDSRDRSQHAPTVTILNPTPGARISGKSPTVVRWQAQDADSDPISLRVEYSTDDGKTYRVLTTGVSGNQISLPGSLFSRTQEARIRVTANDGFNEGFAVTARLSAEGSPPAVRILEPKQGTHFRNDTALRLVGNAFADSGTQLPPKAIKWYDGDRLLGEGSQLSVFARDAGSHTIRLVARDQDREATASVDVQVDAMAPIFIGLKIPETVDRNEDEMRLVVGSSVPGVLVVGDRGYPVDTKPKELKVAIRRGKDNLIVPLVLVAEGKTTTIVAQIKRR